MINVTMVNCDGSHRQRYSRIIGLCDHQNDLCDYGQFGQDQECITLMVTVMMVK